MARDMLHDVVRNALIDDGWIITHDPFEMSPYDPAWEIDLGAEKLLVAEKESEKIAVEIKGFRATSFGYEFHAVLGQYMSYRSGLKRIEAERKLFLAVPLDIYETEFQREGVVNAIADYDVHLVEVVQSFDTKLNVESSSCSTN